MLTLDVDASESETIGDRSVAVVFEDVEILRDGKTITGHEFLALGRSYWERFQERQGKRHLPSLPFARPVYSQSDFAHISCLNLVGKVEVETQLQGKLKK
jgi:hypothetical protein